LPRFGGAFETAVGQFSVRCLLRSRQHRVLLSFYLGIPLGMALFISKAPVLAEQKPGDVWYQVNAPLLGASILMMCAAVAGSRIVFTLPFEPRANWMFRIMPLPDLTRFLPAIRRPLYALAVVPLWLSLAVFFFLLWPWRIAAAHMIILGLVGVIMAELWLHGFRKIPFTCSYQPGKSKVHLAALILGVLLFLLVHAAALERSALENHALYVTSVSVLTAIAVLLHRRTDAHANSEGAALQFDDPPDPAILSLGLYRDGVLPTESTGVRPPTS
jgi:hypothetical protein